MRTRKRFTVTDRSNAGHVRSCLWMHIAQCKRRTIFQFDLLRRRIHIFSSSSLRVKSQSTNNFFRKLFIWHISVNKTLNNHKCFLVIFQYFFWPKFLLMVTSSQCSCVQAIMNGIRWICWDMVPTATYTKLVYFLCFFITQNRTKTLSNIQKTCNYCCISLS